MRLAKFIVTKIQKYDCNLYSFEKELLIWSQSTTIFCGVDSHLRHQKYKSCVEVTCEMSQVNW